MDLGSVLLMMLEKRHGSFRDGLIFMSFRMLVNMVYQWQGLRLRPYNVLFKS